MVRGLFRYDVTACETKVRRKKLWGGFGIIEKQYYGEDFVVLQNHKLSNAVVTTDQLYI